MRIPKNQPGLIFSLAAHGALLAMTLVAFSAPRPFEDAPEATPVEVVSAQAFNELVKGERASAPMTAPRAEKIAETPDLKPTPPAAEARKDVAKDLGKDVAKDLAKDAGMERPEETPENAQGAAPIPPARPPLAPSPPAPAPPEAARPAMVPPPRPANAAPTPEPTLAPHPVSRPAPDPKPEPKPEPRPEPKPEPKAEPPKPEAAEPALKPVARPRDVTKEPTRQPEPTPPRKETAQHTPEKQLVKATKDEASPKPVPRDDAKALAALVDKTDGEPGDKPAAKPALDPHAVAALLAKNKAEAKSPPRPNTGGASQTPSPFDSGAIARMLDKDKPQATASTGREVMRTAALGAAHATGQKMAPTMMAALNGWMMEQYKGCWRYFGAAKGARYVPVVRVRFRQDGALAGEPHLVNPTSDPALTSLAESALRAVRACDPLRIPDQYRPYYEEWKARAIEFNLEDLT